MPATFGIHIGPQNIDMNDLRVLWRKLDARGVEWISLWDHFYETTPPAGGKMEDFGSLDHFETLSALGALAADHLLNGGPTPDRVLRQEIPRFRIKGLLRRALDLGLPNPVLNAALATAPARAFAQRVYFHRRGAGGLDFETWLRSMESDEPASPQIRPGAE